MTPRSGAPSSTAQASLAELAGPVKSGPRSHSHVQVQCRDHTALHLVLEALQAEEQQQGTLAVKQGTGQKYLLKHLLGLLIWPLTSKAKGATGSFKLVFEGKKIHSRKISVIMITRKAGEAKKGLKYPSQTKKDPSSPGEIKKPSFQQARYSQEEDPQERHQGQGESDKTE
ncbi:PREDICTED: histone H1oo-like [Elephantulus edwardii]|uniref:histone H1oo-like n=1 Tax=Elephantulus edwardii TaxID=28737 RepID=UPI0003F0F162|nr:PREDICTED: histone H1oo-like [Elephantulus edwardii]